VSPTCTARRAHVAFPLASATMKKGDIGAVAYIAAAATLYRQGETLCANQPSSVLFLLLCREDRLFSFTTTKIYNCSKRKSVRIQLIDDGQCTPPFV